MSALAQKGILLITTDDRHLPCGALLSHVQHSRSLQTLQTQLNWSDAFKKRLHQHIIKQKLVNQANALALLQAPSAHINRLRRLSEHIKPGDPDNYEGQGAQLYHRYLLKGKSRKDNIFFNHAINYGFAIVRAMLAKYISAHGLHPSLGLFHHNQLNAFNLADDLIEPYRPYVELWSSRLNMAESTIVSTQHKAHLLRILQLACLIDRKRHTLMYAVELTVKSLVTASRTKNAQKLLLPMLDEMPHLKELA